MSTRSLICKYDEQKKAYRAIYCHFDGYIEGVGSMLDANYDTIDKVNALFKLGDISSLKATVEETSKEAYDDSKDRYLTDIPTNVADSDIEFVYLYISKGLWQVYLVKSQVWFYLPDVLKSSCFASRWEAALEAAKDGDCYEQMKQAEQDGQLTDLLTSALDALPDSDYEIFKQRWSEIWASYDFYKGER